MTKLEELVEQVKSTNDCNEVCLMGKKEAFNKIGLTEIEKYKVVESEKFIDSDKIYIIPYDENIKVKIYKE